MKELYLELTPVTGETYPEECNRLERVVHRVIDFSDVSQKGIASLAFALMEAPSDFDYTSSTPPFKRAREFLRAQPEDVRERFRRECEKHPTRANAPRITALMLM